MKDVKDIDYFLYGRDPEPEFYRMYARIRPDSKYADQQADDRSFPVVLRPDMGEYCVRGNKNQYRLADVILYAEIYGEHLRITQEG